MMKYALNVSLNNMSFIMLTNNETTKINNIAFKACEIDNKVFVDINENTYELVFNEELKISELKLIIKVITYIEAKSKILNPISEPNLIETDKIDEFDRLKDFKKKV